MMWSLYKKSSVQGVRSISKPPYEVTEEENCIQKRRDSMAKKYDLVVVGAGPGGAMAAKTAGENGLKTAILERKTNPAIITRSCAVMFAIESDYYFAERMYYNDDNGKMIFPVNGFTSCKRIHG
jgi:NADPH-dependent 2,4-dienoyl-CoA reductase/sulfur reductase-like enzyme